MRPIQSLAVSLALLGCSMFAHAADITYDISGGTLSPSGSFSGSFLINSTTEILDGGTISVTAPSGGTSYTLTSTGVTLGIPGLLLFSDNIGDSFRLAINGPIGGLALNTLASFGAGADTNFTNAAGAVFNATGGSIVPTPEPSSLILLGTGVIGALGVVRRRLLA